MKIFALSLTLAATLTACGHDSTTAPAAPATGVVFTGLNSDSEYQRLASTLPNTMHLPSNGSSKTSTEHLSTLRPNAAPCVYDVTNTYQISNAANNSFTETTDHVATLAAGQVGCPANPPNLTTHIVHNWTSNDYTASKLSWLKRLLDMHARATRDTWIQQIGITSSAASTVTLPDGQTAKTQKITVDIVDKQGRSFREAIDVSTEAWFLGEVISTYAIGLQPPRILYQVTAYHP